MATVSQVYKTALAIMDEDDENSYINRVIPLVNTLIGQCYQMSEDYDMGERSMWIPVEDVEDEIYGIDQHLALAVMPYGLAGLLYIDEDAVRANTWWQIYQESLIDARRNPAEFERINDEYGVLWADPTDGRW